MNTTQQLENEYTITRHLENEDTFQFNSNI